MTDNKDQSLKTDLTGKRPAAIQAELLRARLLLNTYADLERLYGTQGANEICKEGLTITIPIEINPQPLPPKPPPVPWYLKVSPSQKVEVRPPPLPWRIIQATFEQAIKVSLEKAALEQAFKASLQQIEAGEAHG